MLTAPSHQGHLQDLCKALRSHGGLRIQAQKAAQSSLTKSLLSFCPIQHRHNLDAHRICPIFSTTIATKVNKLCTAAAQICVSLLDWRRLFQMSVTGRWGHNPVCHSRKRHWWHQQSPTNPDGCKQDRGLKYVASYVTHLLPQYTDAWFCTHAAPPNSAAWEANSFAFSFAVLLVLRTGCRTQKNILHLMGTWKIMPYLCTTHWYCSRWQGQITTALHCFTICFASQNPSIFH